MTSDHGVRDFLWSLGGLLLLGLGLFYAVGSAVVVIGIHDKRERLPREGIEVTAVVVRWDYDKLPRNRGVKLSYLYENREYRPEIRCRCTDGPGPTMRVWVDPRQPDEFVAENDSTDDSFSIFNSVLGVPFGLLVAALGGALAFVGILGLRDDRRATRKLERYRARKAGGG